MALTDPVPSDSLDVLKRNAEDLDKALNSTSNFQNRVGNTLVPVPSALSQISSAVSQGLIDIQAEVDTVESARANAISDIDDDVASVETKKTNANTNIDGKVAVVETKKTTASNAIDVDVSFIQSKREVAEAAINQDVADVEASKVSANNAIDVDEQFIQSKRDVAEARIDQDVADVDNYRITAQQNIDGQVTGFGNYIETVKDEQIPAQINRLGLEYPPIAYTSGLSLDSYTKTYSYNDAIYVWGGELGQLTSGSFNEVGWQPLQGDIQLRRDIAEFSSLQALIGNIYDYPVGHIAKVLGSEDGQWKAAATTGLTPSQTPADRGAAELVDGSGRLWELVFGQKIKAASLGVKADGTTSDSLALQAGIASLSSAGGGTLDLPSGVILVDGAAGLPAGLYVLSGVYIKGQGISATEILLDDDVNKATVGFEFDTDGQQITDLTINGNRANQTGQVHGLRFHGNAHCYVARLVIKECARYGIGIGYTVDTQIPFRDSTVEDIEIFNVGNASSGDAFDGKRSERCTIRRIYAHDIIANGLDVRMSNTVIQDIYISDIGGAGFSMRHSAYNPPTAEVDLRELRRSMAENIVVERCGGQGFWIDSVEGDAEWFTDEWFGRPMLVNATAKDCGNSGFYCSGERMIAHLSNCHAEGNGDYGFYINPKNDDRVSYKLSNCTAKENQLNGFHAPFNSGSIQMSNCEADGNILDGFFIANDGTQIANASAKNIPSSRRGMYITADSCSVSSYNCDAPTGSFGLRVDGESNSVVGGVISGDGTGIQPGASSLNNIIQNIDLSQSATPVSGGGGSNIFIRCKGFNTESKGSATITSGSSFVNVDHGIPFNPGAESIQVTPHGDLGGASFWVSGVNSTRFTINTDSSLASDVDFSWKVSTKDSIS